MCLAIVKPAGKVIPLEYLDNAHASNKDGFGLVWAESGMLNRVRTLDFVEFRGLVEGLNPAFPALVHLRFGTLGLTAVENCHPFEVRDGAETLAMIHNGHIEGLDCQKGESDTAALARVLSKLPAGWSKSKSITKLLRVVARGSKLAFLRADGTHKIIHEQEGTWKDGVWYSNAWGFYAPRPSPAPYIPIAGSLLGDSGLGWDEKGWGDDGLEDDVWGNGLEDFGGVDWEEDVPKPRKWFKVKPGLWRKNYLNPKGK